jgi:hypothetical protein
MVTFAQAQERAERWVNGSPEVQPRREVRVREFDLGFVAWAEDASGGQVSGGKLVIARDSGDTTLWPALPVGEVIRRYEERYGTGPSSRGGEEDPAPQRMDLNATSFLLTPPQWLQEAADRAAGGDQPSPPPEPAGAGASRGGGGTPPWAPPGAGAPGAVGAGGGGSAHSRADSTGSQQAGGDSDPWGASPGAPGQAPASAPGGTPGGTGGTPGGAEPPGGGSPPWGAPAGGAPAQAPDGSNAPWSSAGSGAASPPSTGGTSGAGSSAFAPAPPWGGPTPSAGGSGAGDRAGAPGDAQSGTPGSAPGTPGGSPPWGGSGGSGTAWPEPAAADDGAAQTASPWMDTSGSGSDAESVAPPMTVFSAPVVEDGDDVASPPSAASEAKTAVMPKGSSLPKTAVHPSMRGQQQQPAVPPGSPAPASPASPATPVSPLPPPLSGPAASAPAAPGGGAADLASADTARASGPPSRPGGGGSSGAGAPVPPPPGAPGTPGARPAPPSPPPPSPSPSPSPDGAGADASGYVPTQMVSVNDFKPQTPGGGSQAGQQPPGQSQSQSPGVHAAATVFAPQGGLPGAPAAPAAPPTPAPAAPAASYGYPQAATGQPTVGSGYMAVLRYRAPDGSEQQLIRRSAPGMPHPEWQILHELRTMNVPPQAVLELHTELQSCELPGGYCARMVRETWPQVRITHTAAYGQDLSSRQAGVRHLVEHQDELQQFADGPPRSAPVRAPLPQAQPSPAIGLDVIGQELAEAFGPQGVFRYDPQSASRQGVPEIVTQSLTWSGLPLEIPPFFWAMAQPGRPVPTLAEVAAERGVQSGADAGSYLVMGTDFGRQLCVQYGTAYIVAVPLEAGPGGQSAPPQFVNASLPQFARCLALLGRMWRLRYGLTPDQAGRWTTDFQAQLAALDPQAVADPESWWSVLLEQMWDGLL